MNTEYKRMNVPDSQALQARILDATNCLEQQIETSESSKERGFLPGLKKLLSSQPPAFGKLVFASVIVAVTLVVVNIMPSSTTEIVLSQNSLNDQLEQSNKDYEWQEVMLSEDAFLLAGL